MNRQPTNLWEIYNPRQQQRLAAQTGLLLCGAIASIGISIYIPNPRSPGWNPANIGRFVLFGLGGGLGSGAIAGSLKLWQQEDYAINSEKARAITWANAMGLTVQAQQEIDHAYYLAPHLSQPPIEYDPEPQPEIIPAPNIRSFDINGILEEATGIGLLGNSGSGKTTLAKLIAGSVGETQVLVLDPHDDPDESQWDELHVIRQFELIVEQLQLLLDLLDSRDKTPLVIICDEWPAVRAWCKKRKIAIADDFLLRYGSEARKFNKLPIFCSQSGNVKALGLEGMGDFLENFLLIRLHKVARKYARNLPDRTILEKLNSVAYACLVGDEPVIHPTHGHHTRVYKGAPPRGLKPLQSLPLSIPLISANNSGNNSGNVLGNSPGKLLPVTDVTDFDTVRQAHRPLSYHLEPLVTRGYTGNDLSETLLQKAVTELEGGRSLSWVVKNILKCQGRNFGKGKQALLDYLART